MVSIDPKGRLEETDFVDRMGSIASLCNKRYRKSKQSRSRYMRHPGDTERANSRHTAWHSPVSFAIELRLGRRSQSR